MASNEKRPKECDWLVMLYMAGDNNLDHEMVLSLQLLLDFGPFEKDAIVAEFDSRRPGFGTKRYDFTDTKPKPRGYRLEAYEVEDRAETSTGNPDTLTEFLNWAEDRYSAQRRLLILSGHGSGTTEDFLMRDENADDFLSIDELKLALENAKFAKDGKKLDIIGMDACYMSMAEICYELREQADILIGAEGLVPTLGWPYSKFLMRAHQEKACKKRPLDTNEVATLIVKEFVEHYQAYDTSVDLAAIKLESMGALKKAFGEFVTTLKQQLEIHPEVCNRLTAAHWNAQTFKSDQFVDLEDLCALIAGIRRKDGRAYDLGFDDTVKEEAKGVRKKLEEAVLQAGCSGFAYQWSHGLSIYFPWAYVSPDYANLTFAKSQTEMEPEDRGTGWGSFIGDLVTQTRRESRYDWKPKPLPGRDRTVLIAECAEACAARATLVPHLKSGCDCGIKKRVHSAVEERAERIISQLEAEGLGGTDIGRELTSEVSKLGRHSTKAKYATTREPWIARREAADRAMSLKNFAPVIGVAWWPHDPPDWCVKSKKKGTAAAPSAGSQVSAGGAR